jgi:hypothetical protein
MSLHADGFAVSRASALVVSGSDLFMNIVGDMVADCGLAVVFPLMSEPPWLSMMRTQPSLVICDCDRPAVSLKGVLGEASVRHLPLLMAWPRSRHDHYARGLALPERVAWLTFPVGHDAFRSTIDGLLAPKLDSVHGVRLAAPGVRLDAAVRVRTLSLVEFRRVSHHKLLDADGTGPTCCDTTANVPARWGRFLTPPHQRTHHRKKS